MAAPRSRSQRIADTQALLVSEEDAWVATHGDGPMLVPLTYAWTGEVVVFATPGHTRTVENLRADGRARLAIGDTRDVVMIDAVLDRIAEFADAADLHAAYVEQRGIDPQAWGDEYVLVVLRPERIQAWREANEIAGRTIVRDGAWLAED